VVSGLLFWGHPAHICNCNPAATPNRSCHHRNHALKLSVYRKHSLNSSHSSIIATTSKRRQNDVVLIGIPENTAQFWLPGAPKSRDLTTRHQIKQIATSWTSVGPRKNRTCWTISELNPVCYDSTAALIVACSFCVQSAILSALIRSPYSRGSTTAATATAARTKTRTGQLQGRRNRQRQPRHQPRTTVAKCASCRHVHVLALHWCRADIEHVDSIHDDAMMTKKTFRNWSISQSHNQSLFYSAPKRCPESWPLCLPHVAKSKTERNRTTNIKSMRSSYNTPWIKHKLGVSIYSNTETSLAMSTLAVWCRVVRSRRQSPQFWWSRDVRFRVFSRPLVIYITVNCMRFL